MRLFSGGFAPRVTDSNQPEVRAGPVVGAEQNDFVGFRAIDPAGVALF